MKGIPGLCANHTAGGGGVTGSVILATQYHKSVSEISFRCQWSSSRYRWRKIMPPWRTVVDSHASTGNHIMFVGL